MGAVANLAEIGRYNGEDCFDYPVCFQCVRWSPFMVYLEGNERAKRFRPFDKGMQLYCPTCFPKQSEFQKKFPGERLYREESILNDGPLMALLGQYRYDHPAEHGLAKLDRIIITENAKLKPYKELAKKSLPLSRKLVLLMDLFPAMHRLANRKFDSFGRMRSAVRAKVERITQGYMNLSETEHSQLQDNFDVLVDRTPMHAKISSQQQTRQRSLFPPAPVAAPVRPRTPSLEEPAAYETVGDVSGASSVSHVDAMRLEPGSDDDERQSSLESSLSLSSQDVSISGASRINLDRASQQSSSQSLQISSQDNSNGDSLVPGVSQGSRRINLHVIDSEELRQAATQRSTQSLHISSQDVSNSAEILVPGSSQGVSNNRPASRFSIRSRVDSESDSSTASSTSSNASTSRKRSLDLSSSSSAETVAPVPSPNDGQQPGPSNKRPRNDIPTNPTPAQFVRNPKGRMPRLLGA